MKEDIQRFKLYLESYCLNGVIYTNDYKLKEVKDKPTNSYINDISLAETISNEISKTDNIEELELIACKINDILKNQNPGELL